MGATLSQYIPDAAPPHRVPKAPALVPVHVRAPVHGKVDEQGFPDDRILVDETPEAGIVGPIAVVPHNEIFPFRDFHRGHVVAAPYESVDYVPVGEPGVWLAGRLPRVGTRPFPQFPPVSPR